MSNLRNALSDRDESVIEMRPDNFRERDGCRLSAG